MKIIQAVLVGIVSTVGVVAPVAHAATAKQPNIVYFLVDNLGFGELGAYGGGILRGADTVRIDKLAAEGFKLLNFAPESQCTPSRAALMTGRYAIRTGNQSVDLLGGHGGLVAWEKTIADVLATRGYDNYIVGKWHIGETKGRLPTDHGFLSWYGVPGSYLESLWPSDPGYERKYAQITTVVESVKGGEMKHLQELTVEVRRNLDAEYMKRAKASIKKSVDAGRPFFLYFNHTMMHMPVLPRDEFKGKSGYGDWSDSLLELDADLGTLLDYLKELGIDGNTIVVFTGDNGPEEAEGYRGTSGFFEGSYFAGSEGNLRTPAIVRYPGKVPAGQVSNEVFHITDMFTTLIKWTGADIPNDRVIDGVDQRAFLEGRQKNSARDGFPYWMGDTLYGVKWHQYKLKFYEQKYMYDPALKLATPYLIDLINDPRERTPFDPRKSWVLPNLGQILRDFQLSVQREPLIPVNAPLDYVPKRP